MTETDCIEKTNDLYCGVLKLNPAPVVLTWHHHLFCSPFFLFCQNTPLSLSYGKPFVPIYGAASVSLSSVVFFIQYGVQLRAYMRRIQLHIRLTSSWNMRIDLIAYFIRPNLVKLFDYLVLLYYCLIHIISTIVITNPYAPIYTE